MQNFPTSCCLAFPGGVRYCTSVLMLWCTCLECRNNTNTDVADWGPSTNFKFVILNQHPGWKKLRIWKACYWSIWKELVGILGELL